MSSGAAPNPWSEAALAPQRPRRSRRVAGTGESGAEVLSDHWPPVDGRWPSGRPAPWSPVPIYDFGGPWVHYPGVDGWFQWPVDPPKETDPVELDPPDDYVPPDRANPDPWDPCLEETYTRRLCDMQGNPATCPQALKNTNLCDNLDGDCANLCETVYAPAPPPAEDEGGFYDPLEGEDPCGTPFGEILC